MPGQIQSSHAAPAMVDASNVQVLEARLDLVPKAEPSRRTPPAHYE